MIKTFLKNSFIYSIGTVLTRGISILLVPVYTRYLTPAEYGIIDLFVIVASIINLTIALEISQAIARFYQDAKSDIVRIEYTSTAFLFTAFMYFMYFIISLWFADVLTILLLDNRNFTNVFILASGAIATNGIFYFVQNQLKWQIQPKKLVVSSVINVIVTASIVIYLLVVEGGNVESIFIGQIIGNIIASIVSIFYAKESYRFIFIYDRFKEMIQFSLPLVLSGIAIFVAMYIDRIAIKELLGLEALGIYGIAYRFALVTSLVMIGFQSSLTPLIYKHYKENSTPKNIAKLFNLFSIFALFVFCGALLFSKEVIYLMTTEAFYSASSLIAPLVLAVFFSNMYIFAPGLGIAKKTKEIAFISIFSAVLNILLNYILIPMIGLYGAALATMLSALSVFIIMLNVSQKYYKIPYNWKKVLTSFFIVIISGIVVSYLFENITVWNIIIKFVYLLIISLVLVNMFFKVEFRLMLKQHLNF